MFSYLGEMFPGYSTMCYLKRGNERVRLSGCDREKEKGEKGTSLQNGRWQKMDELRKMNLGREMSFFKMSDHAFPFIVLSDFFRVALPKLR